MTNTYFDRSDLPYESFERFGLTHDMVDDLPDHIIQALCESRLTPQLPLRVEDEQGNIHEGAARVRLEQGELGQALLSFYPVFELPKLEGLSQEQAERLEKGEGVVADHADDNGEDVEYMHILDRETNQVFRVPMEDLDANIQIVATHLNMVGPEVSALREGKTVTSSVENLQTTVGIDIEAGEGLRLSRGDIKDWANAKKDDSELYFGLNGCWHKDSNGRFKYTPEDEYTEGMWAELNEQTKGYKEEMNNQKMRR